MNKINIIIYIVNKNKLIKYMVNCSLTNETFEEHL